MKKHSLSVVGAGLFLLALSNPAKADCGEVSITEMNWASSAFITEVSKFLMEQGYGCKVIKVPSATVTAATSLAENGKPDIATEMWYNSAPVYGKLEKEGKVKTVANVFSDGGVEGWWIPDYLAESNPELTKIDGVLANPAAVGGRFHNCPEGWGCRVANDNYKVAYEFEKHGMEVFNHGSGETLATSIAEAYEAKKPWFGYYWGPTAILGKYNMVKVDVGPYIEEVHTCAQKKDCAKVAKSDFANAPVVTGVTNMFAETNPDITLLMSKVSFTNNKLNEILAWQEKESASAEEAAVHFITNNKDIWSEWLNDSAKEKLAALLN
jgi:glycine betaine/proline transport system substrate-binding protein